MEKQPDIAVNGVLTQNEEQDNGTITFSADTLRNYEKRLKHTTSTSVASTMTAHSEAEVKERMSRNGWPGGFTAEDFAWYEKMLSSLTPITEPSPVASSLSFNHLSDVEEGKAPRASAKHLSADSTLAGSIRDFKMDKARLSARSSVQEILSSSSSVADISTVQWLEVPRKQHNKIVRGLRHTILNVYRRLFSIVFFGNLIAFIIILVRSHGLSDLNLSDLATAASANILVGTSIRQDYIANFIYQICLLTPMSAPLRIRRLMAKCYEHGGIHSGCGVAGTMWFMLLTIKITWDYVRGDLRSPLIMTFTYILVTLLLAIVILAYPKIRMMSHNSFELMHRFGGWTAIAFFWVEICVIVDWNRHLLQQSYSEVLIKEPTFWFLVLITFHTILPWLRLRKWDFYPEKLSNHALRLHFEKTLEPYRGIAISKSPLFEWHPFATFPQPDNKRGGSLIVSAAGDWTRNEIKNPSNKYWVKGVPKLGVLSMAVIFKRTVIVTTGSGIGPCLSILLDPATERRDIKMQVLWSTPKPLDTYGPEIYNAVLKVDPGAVIIDTRARGRPDMVAMTYQLYVESQAEAVFVISNPALTRKIVYAMESRGVPAFGPIWDS